MKNTAGDDLALLVNSLDKSEKRYFRLHTNTHPKKEDKVYLKVYDHLLQHGVWSEAKIQSAFGGERFLKQLNVVRSQLYHLLMESLRHYHQGKTLESVFSSRFDEIALLFQRKLYRVCDRAAHSARKQAVLLQLPIQELEVIKWQMRLERQFAKPEMHARLQALHARSGELVRQISAEAALLQQLDEVSWQIRNPATANSNSNAPLGADLALMLKEPTSLMFDAQILLLHLHAYRGYLRGDTNAYFQNQSAMIDLWEAMPERIRLEEERYFKMLGNYAEGCSQAGFHEAALKAAAKMQRLLQRSQSLEPSEKLRVLFVQHQADIVTNQWEDAWDKILEIADALRQYGDLVGLPIRLGHLSNILITAFVNEYWVEVKDWAVQLKQELGKPHASVWENLVRIALWVSQYELGQHAQLEAEAKAIRSVEETQFALGLADQLCALVSSESKSDERNAFLALAALFKSYPHAAPSAVHNKMLVHWVEARLQAKSIVYIIGSG